MRRVSLIASALSLFACNPHNIIDQSKVGHIHKVVILGNSIVQHAPLAEIGWNHNWGMAASDLQKDFTHLLINSIHQKNSNVTINFKNIADFEREYQTYQLSQLDSLKGADMYIIRISENVPVPANGFIDYYDKLVKYLNTNKGVLVIVDGFWDRPTNKQLQKYAAQNNLPFILNSDLIKETDNTANGLFENPGVAAHPSDKGMQSIKDRIWEYIQDYF